MRVPDDADRDFTAGCIIVNDDRVLLLKHSKLGMWLQPGGHVEERETPDETAKRETREETGIDVQFHQRCLPEETEYNAAYDLPRPFAINVHEITEGHWHCSMLFLARINGECNASHSHEHDGMKWFSKAELENGTYEMPENVKNAALDALSMTHQSKS